MFSVGPSTGVTSAISRSASTIYFAISSLCPSFINMLSWTSFVTIVTLASFVSLLLAFAAMVNGRNK